MNRFQDQVVIITGASSGIGAALALQVALEGAKVAIAARNVEKLEAVAEKCRANGAQVLVLTTDVTSREACASLVSRTVEHFGRLDMLINNAGISMGAYFREVQKIEFFRTLMDVNYFGTLYCTHAALPHLLETKGRLVAVSSLAGKNGVPSRTGYAAAKHAIAGFLDSLRIELMGSGVSVSVAYPGFVESDMRKNALGPDGRPLQAKLATTAGAISAAECARLTLDMAWQRKRELVMTRKARIGQWLKLIAPGLVDRIALRSIQKSTDR